MAAHRIGVVARGDRRGDAAHTAGGAHTGSQTEPTRERP
jgi:hypothetical protein